MRLAANLGAELQQAPATRLSSSSRFIVDTIADVHPFCVMSSTISFGDANVGFQAGIINGPVNTAFHLPSGKLREGRVSKSPSRR